MNLVLILSVEKMNAPVISESSIYRSKIENCRFWPITNLLKAWKNDYMELSLVTKSWNATLSNSGLLPNIYA